MNNKLHYFLVVAEELNISKAAARLYISQQCLSTHIKKLETEYGTPLFYRQPKLSLTESGEILMRTYQQMQLLENRLKIELDDVCQYKKGRLSIGIHSARSAIIGPVLLERYWKEFPNVTFNCVDGTTSSFEKEILSGRLDFFIGVNPHSYPSLQNVSLLEEEIFVIISDNLLRKYFSSEYPHCKERFSKGIDIKEFEEIPIITFHETSRFNSLLANYLYKNNIQLNTIIFTNNGLLRTELAMRDIGASICSQIRLKNVRDYNLNSKAFSQLNAFPIKGIDYVNKFCLVYHKKLYQPRYIKAFIDIVIDVFQSDQLGITYQ